MALIDDFKVRFPEFDSTVVDNRLPFLEDVFHCYFGANYGANACDDEAILQLLAHLMVLDGQTQNGNQLPLQLEASKSVGSVSVSYTAGFVSSSDRDAFFGLTMYGQMFLMLTRSRRGGYFV